MYESFVRVSSPGETPSSVWKWGTIQSNLFVLKDSKTNSSSEDIMVLDNCAILPVKIRPGSLWASRNYLLIQSSDRVLFKDRKEFCVYCRNGKEMEEWYIHLRKASQKRSIEFERSETEKIQFFNHLHKALKDPSRENGSWFNFLLHRMFYNVHDDPYFQKIVKDKIEDKIKKLNIPKVLKKVSVDHISFGPNLPVFNNLKLSDSVRDGFIAIDSDLSYQGGFKIKFSLIISIELFGRHLEIPASLSATVKHISGRVLVHCSPPPADRLWIGFYESPVVDVEIDSFISKTKVGAISSLIAKKLENEIIETMVLPDMEDFSFPKPSSKHGQRRSIPHITHEEAMLIVQGKVVPEKQIVPITSPERPFKNTPLPPTPVKKEVAPKIDYDLPLLIEPKEIETCDPTSAPPLPVRRHVIAISDANPPTPGGAFEFLTRTVSLKDKITNRVFGNKTADIDQSTDSSDSASESEQRKAPPLPSRASVKKDVGFRDFLKEKIGGFLNS